MLVLSRRVSEGLLFDGLSERLSCVVRERNDDHVVVALNMPGVVKNRLVNLFFAGPPLLIFAEEVSIGISALRRNGSAVSLGIDAPASVSVLREELA